MKPSFVLDASVIVSWFSPHEDNQYAMEVLNLFEDKSAIAPGLCCLEVTNVLRLLEKKKSIQRLDVERALQYVDALPIEIDKIDCRFGRQDLFNLAREHDLTIYDACYLDLAVRLGLPLATLDAKLAEAAERAGVGVMNAG